MAQDGLWAGEDGGVRGLLRLERDLDPMLAAVCPVDPGALLGRQDAPAREGRVAQLGLIPTDLVGRVARVILADAPGNVLVAVDGGVLLVDVFEAAQDNLGGDVGDVTGGGFGIARGGRVFC